MFKLKAQWPWWCEVKSNGEIIAAAFNRIRPCSDYSKNFKNEAEKFAELLSKKIDFLPGVNGPVPAVDAFAEKWNFA